ncbi:hypothetical protein PV327_004838, partial [Microctonus hyperodae]
HWKYSKERTHLGIESSLLRMDIHKRERVSEIIYSQTGSTKSSMAIRWLRGGTAQQQSADKCLSHGPPKLNHSFIQ